MFPQFDLLFIRLSAPTWRILKYSSFERETAGSRKNILLLLAHRCG